MSIAELENEKINPDAGNSNSISKAANETSSTMGKIGSVLQNLVVAGKELPGTIWQGTKDTLFAEKNNVPTSVRLAVGGAQKAEDKLKTLRQFYPDAMPTSDNNFEFTDPVTKKRVLLDDPGISIGDINESLPEFGEMGGAAAGATYGAAGGAALAGPPGAIIGGMLGAGLGGFAGDEAGRRVSQAGGAVTTFKKPIDTRTAEDYESNLMWKGGLNAATAGIPLGAKALKNRKLGQLLNEDSGTQYKYLKEKGYDPTIEQIGSDRGVEMGGKQVAGGVISKQLKNQDVLKNNLDEFLGEGVAGLDQNALANKLRSDLQDKIANKYGISKEAYLNLNFADDVINKAPESMNAINDILGKRGLVNKKGKWTLPKNKNTQSDFNFDSRIEDKIQNIRAGKASEAEIFALEKDISALLRKGDLPYRGAESLRALRDAARKDLTNGNAEIEAQAKAARAAHFDYKNSEDQLDTLLGKAEGISEGVAAGSGEGLTAAQNLERAKKLFRNDALGDDTKAAELAAQLSDQEKRTVLAAILQENKSVPTPEGKSARGFQNSIEKAQNKYNLERIGRLLVGGDDAASLDDIVKQAQNTKAIPEGFIDNSDQLNVDTAITGLASVVDPTYGAAATAGINVARNAPGTYGGSGQALTAMLRGGPIAKQYRKQVGNMALRAADRGEVPGNLTSLPNNAAVMPATLGASQQALGNVGNHPESNWRIPEGVINENIPKDAPILNRNKPLDFDALMAEEAPKSLIDFDSLLSDQPNAKLPPDALPPTNELVQKPPIGEMQPSVDMQSIQSGNAPTPAATPQNLDEYIAKNYGQENATKPLSLDEYIAQNYQNESTRVKPQFENKSIKKYREGLRRPDVLGVVKDSIVAAESGGNYRARAHNSSATGKYQFIDSTREKFFPNSTREEFMNNPEMQEEAMDMLMESNLNDLERMGVDVENIDGDKLAGALWASHLRGSRAGYNTLKNANYVGDPDANGTSPRSYFNRGRNAYIRATNSRERGI